MRVSLRIHSDGVKENYSINFIKIEETYYWVLQFSYSLLNASNFNTFIEFI